MISSSFLETEGASDFTMRLSDIISDADDDHGWMGGGRTKTNELDPGENYSLYTMEFGG